jgi:hypothetical protein
MEWITDRRVGTQTGIIFIIALIMFDAGLIIVVSSEPIGFLTFIGGLAVVLSLPLIGLIAYQLFGLSRSGYSLDRNALTIFWGPIKQIVPTASIQRILLGSEVEGRSRVRRFRGWRWPGLMVGQAEVPEAGLTFFYATAPFDNQLLVITPSLSYSISPADIAGFIESIKARYELGPTQELQQSTVHPPIFDWPLWRDRLAHGLTLAGFVLCAALFAFAAIRFPDLPARLPLHYTIDGLPDRFGPATQSFILPFIGLLALLGNTLLGGLIYRRERMASYVLWGGTIFVQLLLWVGTINLLRI